MSFQPYRDRLAIVQETSQVSAALNERDTTSLIIWALKGVLNLEAEFDSSKFKATRAT